MQCVMMKSGKIYLKYDGYYERFGNTTRPALVRYETHSDYVTCTTYIDGKSDATNINGYYDFKGKPYSIRLVSFFQSRDKELVDYNLVSAKFNHNAENDWRCLLSETLKLHRDSDPLAHALFAIAIDRFDWQSDILKKTFDSFSTNEVTIFLDMLNSISYSVSPLKLKQLKDFFALYGRECVGFYPLVLEKAANECGIKYENRNVHSLADDIIRAKRGEKLTNTSGFLYLLEWIGNDDLTISLQDLSTYVPFLRDGWKSIVLKRLFYDISKGRLSYSGEVDDIFNTGNYRYYAQMRYVFEAWPEYRNVSTEFALDCLKTYRLSEESSFQLHDGILDWAMQKSMESRRPIDLNFHNWLCYCQGGVLLNSEFKGFADFEVKYELNDFSFEEDTLINNIATLRDRYSRRLSHDEEQPVTDKNTGEPVIDAKTGRPQKKTVRVWEDRWHVELPHRGQSEYAKQYIDIFVNWDKKPDNETEDLVFTSEMVDCEQVRAKVEDYILKKYFTPSPYLSLRTSDDIVRLFMYEAYMKAILDPNVEIGEEIPGVEDEEVKNSVRERLVELFGPSLECEYDAHKLRLAQTDSQYRFDTDERNCFVKAEKTYRRKRRIYCAPSLSDKPNLLTKRKVAICQGDMCFLTSIEKEPKWQNYKLIHILEILGYTILENTEAGFMPNRVYNQFVYQVNDTIRFYKRLVCRECGHILFPAYGKSYYKCITPSCSEYNNVVYLNSCHVCKKGIIDSRDTCQCPNEMYICPDCGSCCSNHYYETLAARYRRNGTNIPLRISRRIGMGHADRGMIFCHQCGTQKVDVRSDGNGLLHGRCPVCEPLQETKDDLKSSIA